MAMIKTEQNHLLKAWLVIAGCTILRVAYAQSFPLTPDETNYWQWSRYLAWGYHDQTPMIAWAIRLFTSFLGHTELAVRLPSILSMAVASVYVVLIAKHWFSPKIAFHAALFMQSIFIFNVGAVLATADGLQGAGWAGACYHVARGFQDHQWRQWLAGGFWFGFGLLSKYTMVLFPAFAFIWGLLYHRHRLTAIRPYIGFILGMLMFIPVVAWNAANDWNSVRHVAYLGGANERFQLHFKYFAEYMGSQAGLLTPLVFGMICAAWWWCLRRLKKDLPWIYSYLMFTSLPMVAGFALLSLHTRVYGNWPCAGYLTACVLAAALYSHYGPAHETFKRDGIRRIWLWTIVTSAGLTALVLVHVIYPFLPLPAEMDRTAYEIRGWDKLGGHIALVQRSMPDPPNTFLFGVRYQIASELAFYVPGNPFTVSINRWNRPNVYDYWWRDEDLLGWDAVGVLRDGRSREKLLQVFDRVGDPEPFDIYQFRNGFQADDPETLIKTLYIYRCHGFKGGLRWQPPHQGDIRVSSSARH